MTRTLTFAFERATKNTYRFAELDENGQIAEQSAAIVGTVWVKQRQFNGEAPDKITVTIAA